MPPNHNRSVLSLRIAVITCCGVNFSPASPSSATASRAQRDLLRLARIDAAAGREIVLVVVLPARTREIEQALPLGEAALRIGRGIDEDVAMVERRDQLDSALAQHAVAEHVARHVADARDCERRRRDVDIHLAEMAPHGFPCAACRDAHFLVVVAGRAAGRERIAEPEAGFERDAVRRIRERRRALVGRDDEIRVVFVMADDVFRPDEAVGTEIVGDIEQARNEHRVGGGAFGLHRLARACGQLLRHEAALGADRHDHGVLHLLRLDEAEHLGAEILRPVRPADAAARHLAEAQVHAFDARRIDEDFIQRLRQRQAFDLAAVELDRDRALRLAAVIELIEIRAQRRRHRIDEMAQDAVLVEALHTLRARSRSRPGSRPAFRRAARSTIRGADRSACGTAARPARRCRGGGARSPTCSPANRARAPGADSAIPCAPARRRATARPR